MQNQIYLRFWIAQLTNYLTSVHRASMLSLPNKITKNQQRFPSSVRASEAAKQGPALGVIPVLIPLHPSPNILFVFSQFCTNFIYSSYRLELVPLSSSILSFEAVVSASTLSMLIFIEQEYFLVCTILRNSALRIEQAQSLAKSSAVEQLLVLDNPCGLSKLLEFIYILRATLFIYFKYASTNYSEQAQIYRFTLLLIQRKEGFLLSLQSFSKNPPHSAIRCAASFPLGSIIPKNKSYKAYQAPSLSSAVVPVMSQAVLEALILIQRGSMPMELVNSRIVIRFIILVRLAIYLRLWLRWLQRDLSYFISYKIQLFAVTFGGIQLINAPLFLSYEEFLCYFCDQFDFNLTLNDYCYDLFEVGL